MINSISYYRQAAAIASTRINPAVQWPTMLTADKSAIIRMFLVE
ncbi:hypothetical protein [Geosporobacter ferrireducens]|nr:hypothetical protein [Geosporobacter ferrireducens]